MKFSALAFDLDGTLYPNYRLYIRLVPFLLRNQRLLRAMDKARTMLRRSGEYGADFYDAQAALMAGVLKKPAGRIKEQTERLIYRGWEPFFKNIKLFPYAREALDSFRGHGIKLGLLSDFPPENKLENLEITQYWDAVVCSERAGRLKPDPKSFLDLASNLSVLPENMLYVGNSVPYDVIGAASAGMKTALISPRWKKGPASVPLDFVFHDYRQLRDYVLS